jgi:acyl-CoA reductase-like NAD-dependent aldehyde dehydrogenase
MATTSTSVPALTDQVRRCRQQQEAWARLPLSQRLRPVRALRRLLVSACDSVCAAVARDVDKPPEETLACEILPLADACRFLERSARRLLRPRRVATRQRPLWLWGQSDTVYRRPRGLIGIIGTWNYPIYLNGVQLTQALTAGNGVLWKPSEIAPASAAILCDLLGQAGFPGDLVQLLEATRAAGAELAEAEVDHIVFTGSAATGRRLAETLGRRLVSSTLELSGCDALFVLDDADLNLAARATWFGTTLNRGQTCLAVRRVFVPRTRYAAFTAALAPLAAAAAPQRLAQAAQAEHASRLVHEALTEGARLLAASPTAERDVAGLFTPTVVLDARPDMALCREATFAPVLSVLPFDHLDEAVRLDGLCPYGLGAAIFSANPVRAERLAARLRTGLVTVNEVLVPTAHPGTPFGGRRDSGWGVTQGAEGLLEMTVPQVVSTSSSPLRLHYRLPDGVGSGQRELLHGLLKWSHAATLRQRWRGLLQLLRGLVRGDG